MTPKSTFSRHLSTIDIPECIESAQYNVYDKISLPSSRRTNILYIISSLSTYLGLSNSFPNYWNQSSIDIRNINSSCFKKDIN